MQLETRNFTKLWKIFFFCSCTFQKNLSQLSFFFTIFFSQKFNGKTCNLRESTFVHVQLASKINREDEDLETRFLTMFLFSIFIQFLYFSTFNFCPVFSLLYYWLWHFIKVLVCTLHAQNLLLNFFYHVWFVICQSGYGS